MADDTKLGATGEFPEGKLGEGDEGELQFAVGVHEGNIVIDFGTPVAWVAMPPELARQVAELLLQHAKEAGA